MIVYLAGFKTIEKTYTESTQNIWLLSSFFEHRNGAYGHYVTGDKHILDSGAFSTFKDPQKAKLIDWKKYVGDYIHFIRKTNQKLFFELDIDGVVGLEKVEYFRKMIEDGVGIAPIPVWHANRKWEYYLKMVEQYPYVAVGTTSANLEGRIFREKPELLKMFIDTAHKNKVKIHGLGFTKTDLLPMLKFDSVDSTTWLGGGKFACMYQFKDKKIKTIPKPKGLRTKQGAYKDLNIQNFNEWVKFQKYAENEL